MCGVCFEGSAQEAREGELDAGVAAGQAFGGAGPAGQEPVLQERQEGQGRHFGVDGHTGRQRKKGAGGSSLSVQFVSVVILLLLLFCFSLLFKVFLFSQLF